MERKPFPVISAATSSAADEGNSPSVSPFAGLRLKNVLPERAGVLEEIVSPPWAHGLDIRTARGWQWFQLIQHADGDASRLRQIQVVRGYKRGWVRYAMEEATEKQQTKIRGVAA